MYGHPLLGYMPGYKPRRNSRIAVAVRIALTAPAASLASLKPLSETFPEWGFFSASPEVLFFRRDVVAPSETPVDRSTYPKKARNPEGLTRRGLFVPLENTASTGMASSSRPEGVNDGFIVMNPAMCSQGGQI